MKKVLSFFLRNGLFWMTFFAVARLLFFLLNQSSLKQPESIFKAYLDCERHGLRLDLSIAGYLILVGGLCYTIGVLVRSKTMVGKWVYLWNKALYVVFGVFLAVNARLYKYWGYHIDGSVLEYLRTPKEALASANGMDWLVTILLSAGLLWVTFLWHRFLFKKQKDMKDLPKQWMAIPALLCTALMIVPIRGGVDVATVGVSSSYFSEDNFKNHTALNPIWNLSYSLTEQSKGERLDFMLEGEAEGIRSQLYGQYGEDSTLILPSNTNVIFIVLESFTANVVEEIGGFKGVTPNLNRWLKKGMSFSNFYSSGDRSDRGLTTLFTGFPSLPNGRLLKYPNKLSRAPNLYRNLNNRGYSTAFYYGGNLEFANLKLLFTEGKVNKVVSKSNLSADLEKGKWGVRDEDMFNLFLSDIKKQEQPFFSTLYTLSSHEPFDVPEVSFKVDRPDSKFFEAIYYTDSCFGDFMDKFASSRLWENTIVVVTADHGVRKPEDVVLYSPRKFRVPLLMVGGLIDSPQRYDHYCSHTDLPFTIEKMMFGNTNREYQFSKSVFDDKKSYAHYYYNLGAGMVNPNGCVVYDIKAKYFLVNTTTSDTAYTRMQQEVLGVAQSASKQFEEY